VDEDATWCGGRPQPRGRGLCVRWGPSPSPKRGQSPQFLAPVYCGQTAAWIKMPLGTELGLGPDDILLDGDPAPPRQKGDRPPSPIFGPCLLWPNGWMDQDTWQGGRPQPRRLCVRWRPSPSPENGAEPPNFRPTSVVAKRLDELRCHLYGGRPWPMRHYVRWGPSSPSPNGAQPPIFGQCPLFPNGWMD